MAANDDLRQIAANLERQIEADRPGRHAVRMTMIGRAIVSGWQPVRVDILPLLQTQIHESGEPAERIWADLHLFDDAVLAQQGFEVRDGILYGPRSCPTGAPPRYGLLDVADSGGGGSSGSGGSSVSVAEARDLLNVTRKHMAWSDGLREFEVFTSSQNRRAWLIGRHLGLGFLASAVVREAVRKMAAAAGDADEIALWTDGELRADYRAGELGPPPDAA